MLKEALKFIKECGGENIRNMGFDVKEDDNLYMVSYTEEVDLKNPIYREINGIILEKGTNLLVHHAFGKTYEGFDLQEVEDSFEEKNLKDYSIELLLEGSLIRIFFYEDEWKIGTSRNINGVYSHWGSEKSFKELFLETTKIEDLGFSFENLDTDYCYSFILQHPEIKLGLDIKEPNLILLNRININTLEEENFTDNFKVDMTFEELKNKQLNFAENYIVINGQQRIKFTNNEYMFIKQILNNNPSMKWCYIDSIQKGLYQYFRYYFPSSTDLFDYIDQRIHQISSNIQKEYYEKHVNKNYNIKYTKKFEKTIYQLHSRFLRTKEKTTINVVKNHILGLKINTLYWLLSI